jgi:hypothetical protein
MKPPIFWPSGGHVMCAEGPLALTLARRLLSVCAEEEAEATHRAAALRAVRETLSAALATAEAWRRAAGWDNPDAADDILARRQ